MKQEDLGSIPAQNKWFFLILGIGGRKNKIRSRIVDFADCRRAVNCAAGGSISNDGLSTTSWRLITVVSWRIDRFSLMKIRQCGREGGLISNDGLSILRTVDSLGGAVDSAARGESRLKDALSILRTVDSLG